MMRVRSDEQLARLVASGDERAFAAIYDRHQGALYRYCLTIVRDPDDARDVLQSVMANALAALQKRAPDAPVKPWLFRITHNEAISALRRRRPAAELHDDAIAPDLEVTVERRARLRQLVTDLRALPERQRAALVMRELSGLSHAEIAAALGVSAPQAKQAILEARVSLQEAEKGRAMICPDVRAVISAQDGRRLRARSVRAHLRGCDDCRALRDAIGTRAADLRVLAPPLPAVASAGLLASLFGGGSVSLAGKAAIGLTVAVTAGAGVTEVTRHHDRPQPSEQRTGPAATPTPAPSATAPTATPATSFAASRTSRGAATATPGRRARVRSGRGRGRGRPAGPSVTAPVAPVTPPATPGAPAQTPEPARTPRPVKTAKPARTPKPAKTAKPVKTPKPEQTPAPSATPTATKTPRPDKARK